jgi:hypothetical protein
MNIHEKFASDLTYILHGVEPGAGHFRAGVARTTKQSHAVKLAMCNIAAAAYEAADMCDLPEYHLFSVLGKQATWNSNFDAYSDSVMDALGNLDAEFAADDDAIKSVNLVKQACGFEKKADGNFVDTATNFMGMANAVAALGGGGLGALHWYLNRDSSADEKDIEALKAKERRYRSIAAEVQQQLTNRRVAASAAKDMVRSSIALT